MSNIKLFFNNGKILSGKSLKIFLVEQPPTPTPTPTPTSYNVNNQSYKVVP